MLGLGPATHLLPRHPGTLPCLTHQPSSPPPRPSPALWTLAPSRGAWVSGILLEGLSCPLKSLETWAQSGQVPHFSLSFLMNFRMIPWSPESLLPCFWGPTLTFFLHGTFLSWLLSGAPDFCALIHFSAQGAPQQLLQCLGAGKILAPWHSSRSTPESWLSPHGKYWPWPRGAPHG